MGTLQGFLVSLLALVVFIYFPSASATELYGEHVCTVQTWQSSYQYVNVSYGCWQTTYAPCPEDFHHSRWKRHDHRYRWRPCRTTPAPWPQQGTTPAPMCIRTELTTCYKMVRRCVTNRVTTKYCCPGFEEEGGTCVATVQCSYNNGGCSHLCHTGYNDRPQCGCMEGYTLQGDDSTCVDADECSAYPHLCDQHCQNTNGSYYCRCRNGYRLSSPNTCEEINECALGNGGCEQKCVNTEGAFYCDCDDGFELVEGFTCEDIDECSLHGLNGGCSHECVNTWGSYQCACPEGKVLGGNGKTCVDSDGTTKALTTPFREEAGSYPPRGQPANPGAERLMEGDDDKNLANLGLIIGCIIGALVILCLILLALFLVRRLKCCSDQANAYAEPGAGAVGIGGIAVIAPPLPPKKCGYASNENHYEVPAHAYLEPQRGYANLAYKQEKADYPDPPPAYDNALYGDNDKPVVPPEVVEDGGKKPALMPKPGAKDVAKAEVADNDVNTAVDGDVKADGGVKGESNDDASVSVKKMKAMFEQ